MTLTALFFLIILLAGIGFAFVAPFLILFCLIRLIGGWKELCRDQSLAKRDRLLQLIRHILLLHPVSPSLHNFSTLQK